MKRSVWACNCPICRVMVHRVVGKVVGSTYIVKAGEKGKGKAPTNIRSEEFSKEMAEKIGNRPVEVIKLGEIREEKMQPTPQTGSGTKVLQQVAELPSLQEKAKEKEERKEEVKQVQVQIPPEVMEKISSLENEVTEIRKYIETSVEGIKATLVDLRSAIAEIDNPFNVLRKYSKTPLSEEQAEEQALGNVQKPRANLQPHYSPAALVTHHLTVQPGIPMAQQALPHQTVKSVGSVQTGEGVKGKQGEKEEGAGRRESKIDFSLYTKLAEWVNKITERVPSDVLEKLISSYVEIGVIDENIGNVLKKIVKTVNELKSLNLDINEQAKYLYELIQALGLTSSDVVKKVLPATEKAEEKMAQEFFKLVNKENEQHSKG